VSLTLNQADLREKIQSVLVYSSWEGQDLLRGEPHNLKISLLFDRNFRPIVLTEDLWQQVNSGIADVVVAARIDEGRLIKISSDALTDYTPLEDAPDGVDLESVLQWSVAFMEVRREGGEPYYGAIGANPHWGSDDTFPIFKHGHTFNKIEESVENWWAKSALCSVGPTSVSISFPKGLGAYIDDDDLHLLQTWSNEKAITSDIAFEPITREISTEHLHLRNGISARIAEKTAISIYSAINGSAEDCSILQIYGQDRRWKSFDIFSGKPIDVKNVNVYRNNVRQSFVSKFKKQDDKDVIIAAIATRATRFTSGRDRYSLRIHQTFLGELSKSELICSKDAVDQIFRRAPFSQIQIEDRYLPAWSFELPLLDMDYSKLIDAYDLFGAKPESILSAAIAAGSPERASAYGALNPAQKKCVDALVFATTSSSYSKRTLALFMIAGFAEEVVCGRSGKSFILFIKRMMSLDPISGHRSHYFRLTHPEFGGSDVGGLYDPLGALASLQSALLSASDHIQTSGLSFDSFHAPSPSVLLGRLREGSRITIYTHCGGRSERGGPCDTFPLVLGKNPTCAGCGKLVCHECGHCTHHCPAADTGPFAEDLRDHPSG
jgi:hypothetical protein